MGYGRYAYDHLRPAHEIALTRAAAQHAWGRGSAPAVARVEDSTRGSAARKCRDTRRMGDKMARRERPYGYKAKWPLVIGWVWVVLAAIPFAGWLAVFGALPMFVALMILSSMDFKDSGKTGGRGAVIVLVAGILALPWQIWLALLTTTPTYA